jgi:hypothetical protein
MAKRKGKKGSCPLFFLQRNGRIRALVALASTVLVSQALLKLWKK